LPEDALEFYAPVIRWVGWFCRRKTARIGNLH